MKKYKKDWGKRSFIVSLLCIALLMGFIIYQHGRNEFYYEFIEKQVQLDEMFANSLKPVKVE